MQNNNNVCRFCLKLVYDANMELINRVRKKMLAILLIKLDLDVTEDPLICKMCLGILDKIYKFKSKCLYSEHIISSRLESNVKVRLRDILIELKNEPDVNIAEDVVVCRLCIKIPTNGSYVDFSETSEEVSHCRDIIQMQLPEINLNIIGKPTICEACHVLLKYYSSFATNCVNVEQKIKLYCEYQESDVKEHVDLPCVLQFTENKALSCENSFNGDLIIKQEESSVNVKVDKVEDEEDNLSEDHFAYVGSSELYFKEEEIEIKSEDDQIRIQTSESNCSEDIDSSEKNDSSKENRCFTARTNKGKKRPPFFCHKCPYSSNLINNINKHIGTHSENELHRCTLCSFVTDSRLSLKAHTSSHSGPTKAFGCGECTFETDHKFALQRHVRRHKDNSEVNMHECPVCPFKSKYKKSLREHKTLQHKNGKCANRTRYRAIVLGDQKLHMKPKEMRMYRCEKCPYQSRKRSHFMAHVVVHSDERPFSCDECTYKGKSKKNLLSHMLLHKEDKLRTYQAGTTVKDDTVKYHQDASVLPKLKCIQCPFETTAKRYLSKHMKGVHKRDKPTLKCSQCLYVTTYKHLLRSHLLTHQEATLQCYQCDFRARHKKSMRTHMARHDPSLKGKVIPTFKCDKCEYCTLEKGGLKRHQITHMELGETTAYKCATCDFQTKYKHSLRYHTNQCMKRQKERRITRRTVNVDGLC